MYIRVKVITHAKKESITEKSEDVLEISVKEKAERNMANDHVRELVAIRYRVPVDAVRIINGHHSPVKLISIRDDIS